MCLSHLKTVPNTTPRKGWWVELQPASFLNQEAFIDSTYNLCSEVTTGRPLVKLYLMSPVRFSPSCWSTLVFKWLVSLHPSVLVGLCWSQTWSIFKWNVKHNVSAPCGSQLCWVSITSCGSAVQSCQLLQNALAFILLQSEPSLALICPVEQVPVRTLSCETTTNSFPGTWDLYSAVLWHHFEKRKRSKVLGLLSALTWWN